MTIQQYLDSLIKRYKTGISTEHSYRGDLQNLLESLNPDVMVTNEPAHIACGAPDYIITKKNIPVGYIEAKDVGVDLNTKSLKEQLDRYRASLNNLIITDYLDFHLYIDGEFITSVKIADIQNGQIVPLPESFTPFDNLLTNFCTHIGQTIKSSRKLAEMMAGKARMLADVIEKALNSDVNNQENSSLHEQLNGFKQVLIHDIKPREFADIYAQSIAYGMFAARLHDPTLDTFDRKEAAELIPKTNPFLRKLFQYIAGYDLDDRIKWIVDDLADIFRATNVAELLKDFGKATQQHDPIIHFYETFLSEYDPKLRKSRGVWYTPAPVVNFIVRAVDDILKSEFGLPQGLADTSKTKIKVQVQGTNKTTEVEVHKVQILDPATGTGTFLAEVVKQIYKNFEGQQGIWSKYVEDDLIPRLNGFEILMASYAMAHLKLDILLSETGYKPKIEQRYKIFLCNSLEEHHPDTGTLFASWLSQEANEANSIKRDTPVMVVMGNPPYSGESANKGEWIMSLMEDYKREPGGKEKLNEKNPKWINDDYVKFLRYGQYYIEKNGSGVLAFINAHGFLDNPTFRGMRWNLLKTFDKIYILDLHGNSKKKEVCPDGSPDINVFDIMQGVSINLFIKTGNKKANDLGKVFHFDIFGKREMKYDFLWNNSLASIAYKELPNVSPNYFFVDKDFEEQKEYDIGFLVNELFIINGVGMTTAHDEFVINENKDELLKFYKEFQNTERNPELLHKRFKVKKKEGWNILHGYDNIKNVSDLSKFIEPITYRPFDDRFIFYEDKLVWRTVRKVMQHFVKDENLGLVIGRQGQVVGSMSWNLIFLTKSKTDFNVYYRGGGMAFPLYLYPESTGQMSIEQSPTRTPNLNKEIIQQIAEKLGLLFISEKTPPNLPKGEALQSSTFGLPGYITANPLNYKLIKEMRDTLKDNPTEAEKVIWEHLKNKKTGHKIRRQHIIDDFITNFVCLRKKVVIEIDGKIHLQQKEYDELRTERLNDLGYEIIRFTNEEVFTNAELVTQKIKDILDKTADIQNDLESNSPPLEGLGEVNEFAPIDILDYIYAVLHNPTYRNKYKEFLKIDFPRIPYPKDQETFWQLVKLGSELRHLHLLESPKVMQYITGYPEDGGNLVDKVRYEDQKVWINSEQYFENVPLVAWGFYIGGYQPAQKWLKDRKGRTLSWEDISHYQKIIVALTETDRIMKEIDKIKFE